MEEFLKLINFLNIDWSNSSQVVSFMFVVLQLLFVIVLLIAFIRNFNVVRDFLYKTAIELKKVDWSSRRESTNVTLLTVVFMVLLTMYIYGLDQIFYLIRSTIFSF